MPDSPSERAAKAQQKPTLESEPDDAALCVIDAKTDKMIAQLLTGTKALDAYYQCSDEQGFAKTTPWHEAAKQSQSFFR